MLPKQTNKLLPLLALMLIIGAFCMSGATAYAAEDPPAATEEAAAETLSVDEVWLAGDTLHITVTDKESGETEMLELNLGDYAKAGDEYVSVQATDSAGRSSNTIKFRNPYYQAGLMTGTEDDGGDQSPTTSAVGDSETATGKPFTPDGAGSVVDDATDGDGKEFFTVSTADGNVFYLIVDRQRDSDNVYLLNAVTEEDLGSLAKEGNGLPGGAVETPATAATPEPTPTATPEPLPEPEPAKSDGNTSMYILIVIAALAAGGAGYYLKIVRPKKYGADDTSDDEYDEPQDEDADGFDDDEELDFTEVERGESE